MPRPVKCRKVCHFPQNLEFFPGQRDDAKEPIILAIDEYETIRLIDKEGMSQVECGEFMGVARTTVQRVYEIARKKLADAIVDGRPLRIEGGDFWLCDGQNEACTNEECFKQVYHEKYSKQKDEYVIRIAVPQEEGTVYQYFGHTKQFELFDILNKEIVSKELVEVQLSGHVALVGMLNAMNVDALICGGIGEGAKKALQAAGIQLYGGVAGDADQAVKDYIEGCLVYDPDVKCKHEKSAKEGKNHGWAWN